MSISWGLVEAQLFIFILVELKCQQGLWLILHLTDFDAHHAFHSWVDNWSPEHLPLSFSSYRLNSFISSVFKPSTFSRRLVIAEDSTCVTLQVKRVHTYPLWYNNWIYTEFHSNANITNIKPYLHFLLGKCGKST